MKPTTCPALHARAVEDERRERGEVRVVERVPLPVAQPEPVAADLVPADREDRPVGDGDERLAELAEDVVAVVVGDVGRGSRRRCCRTPTLPKIGKTYGPPSSSGESSAGNGKRPAGGSGAGGGAVGRLGLRLDRLRAVSGFGWGVVTVVGFGLRRASSVFGRRRGRRRLRRRLRLGLAARAAATAPPPRRTRSGSRCRPAGRRGRRSGGRRAR